MKGKKKRENPPWRKWSSKPPKAVDSGGTAADPPARRLKAKAKPVSGKSKAHDATAWVENARWYDQLVGDAGSEYHRHVVLPGVLKLMGVGDGSPHPLKANQVLDLCCGQGVLCRLLHKHGAHVTGIDASAPLIAMARQRGPAELRYVLADAAGVFSKAAKRAPRPDAAAKPMGGTPTPGSFDVVTCILALQDLADLDATFASAARALRPGGHFIAVVMHPCFRAPKHSHWGWDEKAGVQFRRVDRYLTPFAAPILTHPGSKPDATTTTHHRPLRDYLNTSSRHGLLIDTLEEWPSHKHSDSGPRASAENIARRELPMFLAWRAVKVDA